MLWLSVFVCGVKGGGGWVGLGLLWDFFCAKNTLSILFHCYIISNCFMMHLYAHILIVSCLRATGVHNSWAPVKCVFVSVGAHSFMVSFFPFSGAHSLLVFFFLWLLVNTCCLVTVKYCLYTISQFKYAHTWSINHMYRVVERKQGNKYRKKKKKKEKKRKRRPMSCTTYDWKQGGGAETIA